MLLAFLQVTCFGENTVAKLDKQSLTLRFQAVSLPSTVREVQMCQGFLNLSYNLTFTLGTCNYQVQRKNYQFNTTVDEIMNMPAGCTSADVVAAKSVPFYTTFEGIDGRFEGNTQLFEKQIFDYTQCIIKPKLLYGNWGDGLGFVFVNGESTNCQISYTNLTLVLTIASTNGTITLKRGNVSVSGFKQSVPNVAPNWSILGLNGALHFNCSDLRSVSLDQYWTCIYALRAVGTSGVFYSQATIVSTSLVNGAQMQQTITAVVTEASMARNTYVCHSSAVLTIDGTFYRIQFNVIPGQVCDTPANGTQPLGLFAVIFLVRNYAIPQGHQVFKLRRNVTGFNPNMQFELLSSCKSDNFPDECEAGNQFEFAENRTQRLSIYACHNSDCFTPNVTIAPFTIKTLCHSRATGRIQNQQICVMTQSTCDSVSTMLQLEIYDEKLQNKLYSVENLGKFPNEGGTYCFALNTELPDSRKIVGLMRIDDYTVAIEHFDDYTQSHMPFVWAPISGALVLAVVAYIIMFYKAKF